MKTTVERTTKPASKRAKPSAKKRWNRTGIDNLVRHESGGYYARLSVGGKQTWRSLKTQLLEVAKSKLGELVKEAREVTVKAAKGGKRWTVADAIEKRLAIITTARTKKGNLPLKPATKHYYNQCIETIRRTWPELEGRPVSRVTKEECEEWSARMADDISPQRFNNVIAELAKIFDVAVQAGHRFGNPAEDLSRMSVPTIKEGLKLPSKAKFAEFVEAMRSRKGRFSEHSAFFVELLAYSGMRKGEAENLRWRDVDFEAGFIAVHGDPETGTKGGESRKVPMISALRGLLQRLLQHRHDLAMIAPCAKQHGVTENTVYTWRRNEDPRWLKFAHRPNIAPPGELLPTPVCAVSEAQGCMTAAAEEIGMERLTHHDLRHYFATICIEAGVDIPTVSRWLGHKDGGVLALRTYGHSRDEHSTAAAARVSFDAAPAENVLPFKQASA
jgi:integrase